ncbi:MAG: SLBB domain-containing protein [Ignavibacteria bacterium]|nr:SLBB domain-containing protein [Ignavibacteria bacterium]
MKKNLVFLIGFLLLFIFPVHAQSNNVKIGTNFKEISPNGAVYDYSVANALNMHVSVWGYVRLPGRYIVPTNLMLSDIISYAGGPSPDALLNDIRVIRTYADSTQKVFTFNYNDLMFEPKVKGTMSNMVIQAGDIIILPGEPRFYFRDYFTMTLAVVSTLISLSILVLNIVK